VDQGLVIRARNGDRDAFEAVARAIGRRVYVVAYRILRDPDQADDAVQTTLIAVWRDLPGLRDPERFEAWVDRLVVRSCLRLGRRRRRLGVTHVSLPDEHVGTTDAIADVATRDELARAFSMLSVEHRAVLVLHHYLGFSHREIGELVGIPPGTVGSRIHHATQRMRASLESDARTPLLEGRSA
jgi:RNA polymerase sigma-70 factor (ECF subfamily)